MSTKVIFRRAEVCLPRRPRAVLPRSQVLSERENGGASGRLMNIYFLSNIRPAWPVCGRLGRQTFARTKTSARLKITFVDMTYPKGWTGSLPLCPLIFSWHN